VTPCPVLSKVYGTNCPEHKGNRVRPRPDASCHVPLLRLTFNQVVPGSIPGAPTTNTRRYHGKMRIPVRALPESAVDTHDRGEGGSFRAAVVGVSCRRLDPWRRARKLDDHLLQCALRHSHSARTIRARCYDASHRALAVGLRQPSLVTLGFASRRGHPKGPSAADLRIWSHRTRGGPSLNGGAVAGAVRIQYDDGIDDFLPPNHLAGLAAHETLGGLESGLSRCLRT
jgi:hypothetical protein